MMSATTSFRFLLATILAATVGVTGASEASAWSFGSWGSFGGWGSFGSSGSWGSCGSYGSYRVRYRPVRYYSVSHGGSHGSYGSYGSTSASRGYGWYSASAGRTSGTTYAQRTSFAPEAPDAAADSASSAVVHVSVPAEAKIYVDDRVTTSTGPERDFVAREFTPGKPLEYQFRIEFEAEGKQVSEEAVVQLQPGDFVQLNYGADSQNVADDDPRTRLTLRVPENAVVTMNGKPTTQQGELRTYETSALPRGERWNEYAVRVEVERRGRTLVEEQTLTLVGGEDHNVKFDFAEETFRLVSTD